MLHLRCHYPLYFLITTWLLISVSFIPVDLYLPSLPAISNYFNASPGMAQATATAFLISFAISQLFYGPLSDYFGRRPFLLLGLIIYIIGGILTVTATSITLLIIARFIQGLGIGVGFVLARALLRDTYEGSLLSKMISYVNSGVAAALTLAPAIGGWLQAKYNFYGNLWLLLISGSIVFIMLWFLPETRPQVRQQRMALREVTQIYLQLLINRDFIANVFCSAVALAALIAYITINPFIFQQQLSISASVYGLLALIMAACETIGSFTNGMLVMHCGTHRMLWIGSCGLLVAGSLLLILNLAMPQTLWTILLPCMLLTFSSGIILPNASSRTLNAFQTHFGTVAGMYSFLQLTITAIISAIISALSMTQSIELATLVISLAVIAILVIKQMMPRTNEAT